LDVPREIMPHPLDDDPTPIAAWMQSGMLNSKFPVIASLG
jgi:hypothetical protein